MGREDTAKEWAMEEAEEVKEDAEVDGKCLATDMVEVTGAQH